MIKPQFGKKLSIIRLSSVHLVHVGGYIALLAFEMILVVFIAQVFTIFMLLIMLKGPYSPLIFEMETHVNTSGEKPWLSGRAPALQAEGSRFHGWQHIQVG